MAKSHTKRAREMHEAEAAGLLPLDQSCIVHTFDDGWTIRELVHAGDFRRESVLMSNCVDKYVYKDLEDADAFTMLDRTDIKAPLTELRLVSLRDASNLPHASCWLSLEHGLYMCLGYHNSDLAERYDKKLSAWACAEGYAYHGGIANDGRAALVTLQQLIDNIGAPDIPAQDAPADETTAELPACYADLRTPPAAVRITAHGRLIRDMTGLLIHASNMAQDYPNERDELLAFKRQIAQLLDSVSEDATDEQIDEFADQLRPMQSRIVAWDDRLYEQEQSQLNEHRQSHQAVYM